MGIWGKIAGAAAGLAIGGPIGGLLGAVAGHYAIDRKGAQARPRLVGPGAREQAERQIAFTIGVIALGAKMAKADGHVSRNEVAAFRKVFHVPPGEVDNVARVFNLAKRDTAGYQAYAAQLARMFGKGSQMLEDVLDGLFVIATADHRLHHKEREFLADVARIFGFDAAAFDRISARHVEPDEADPYAVLGVSRGAPMEDIRRSYLKLVREHHPDRMIARGVPEEFVTIATDRLSHINDAYDRVSREKGR